MGTSRKRLLSMYIYMFSRWISIEKQRYHIDFWFRGRCSVLPKMRVVSSIVSDVQIIPFRFTSSSICMVDMPRSSVPTGSNAALFITDNESSQNKWLGWLLFIGKVFINILWHKRHEARLAISCFLFYETSRPCISAAKGCEKFRKKEWGSLKVSARLAY
jgi:hypothetical protein